MIIGKSREKDLIELEKLVQREKLAGHIVHHFYYHLRTLYPLEFIYLARNHNKSSAGHQYYIQQSKEKINKIYGTFINYLIEPPKTNEQFKEFEYAIKKLQQLLINQTKEN